VTHDEAIQQVGATVAYCGRRGIIDRIVSLPLVRFDDGECLQVSASCLELVAVAPHRDIAQMGTLF
jgi:hypothetical protein